MLIFHRYLTLTPKSDSDKARGKTWVNLGWSLSRWRELWDLKGFKTKPELALFECCNRLFFTVLVKALENKKRGGLLQWRVLWVLSGTLFSFIPANHSLSLAFVACYMLPFIYLLFISLYIYTQVFMYGRTMLYSRSLWFSNTSFHTCILIWAFQSPEVKNNSGASCF